LTADEQSAFDLPGSRPELPSSAAKPAKPRKPAGAIPEAIEGSSDQHPAEDALASVSVLASLRTVQADSAPFALLALRDTGGTMQAQLAARAADAGLTVLPGWYGRGDSPAPGWRVLDVTSQEATLMTPAGNVLRLGPRPARDPSSSATAQTRAPTEFEGRRK
jgi:hypothetical protein